MKKAIRNINTCLSIYLSPEECEHLHKLMLATTCRSKSEYARKMLFNEPVRVLNRNESIDDLIEEMVCLRKELVNLVGKALLTEGEWLPLLQIVKEIKEKINQMADHVCKSQL